MLAGPIAKVSLRSSPTVQKSELEVLQAVKGDSFSGNLETAPKLWNDTIQSLNDAGFPTNQLLDYLPTSTADWIYVANEWNPTWSMICSYTEETDLHNVTGSGNGTFYDAIDAFPAYRDTFDPLWFDTSKFRVQQDFDGWENTSIAHSPNETSHSLSAAFFFTLIQSDPLVDDRMMTNNGTLQMSLSVLHAKDFFASNYSDTTEGGARTWRPFGPVGNASFSRVECNITRKPYVLDEDAIPWIWTNDTYDITMGYAQYWMFQLEDAASKNLLLSPPAPKDLLRFYQVYMATSNTIYASPSLRRVSMLKDTVQLSVVFLVILISLTLLTLWQSGRYFIFLRRHKSKLGEIYIPDGKLEWMIHGAKLCEISPKESIDSKKAKDRDHFQTAFFGNSNFSDPESPDAGCRPPGLARIYSGRGSISSASPGMKGSVFITKASLIVHEDKGLESDQPRMPNAVKFPKEFGIAIASIEDSSSSISHDNSPPTDDEKMLGPHPTRTSSNDGSHPPCQCGLYSPKSYTRTMIEEIELNSPTDSSPVAPDEKM
jgi:hypothetical protein